MIRSVFSAVIIAVLTAVTAGAAFDSTQWRYQADVNIEEEIGEYCTLMITPELYDIAKDDLSDIRLVDGNGEQIPYVIARPPDAATWQRYQPALINRAANAGGAATVTLDFGGNVMKNAIDVVTRGNNFRRAVKVEGSGDNIEFFVLVERAYVFAVDYNTRFEHIEMPMNDYRYLRISVSPMESEQESPVINRVDAFRIEEASAEHRPVEMTLIEQSEDEEKHLSIYVYDVVYRHLPISEIQLGVADDSFYRYATVEGRDAETYKVEISSEDNRQRFREVEAAWIKMVGGAIYRYTSSDGQKHENLILHIPSGSRVYRYLRINISNYDDRPLTVDSVSADMAAHKLVFEDSGTGTTLLYAGSESAKKPSYDLNRTLSNPLEIKTGRAVLGSIIDNPLFEKAAQKPVAFTEKHRILLLIVLVIAALALGGFIFKSFTSIKNEQLQG